jgi:hypothetical protein
VAWWDAQYKVPFPVMQTNPRYFVQPSLHLAPEVPLKADARRNTGRPKTKRFKSRMEKSRKMSKRGE